MCLMSLKMETMLSERGKKLIIVNKYTFRKDKESLSGVSYRCTKKSCTASITVDISEQVLLQTKNQHNHPCSENLNVKVRILMFNYVYVYKVVNSSFFVLC